MGTAAQHPAGEGLCRSGYVVSVVYPSTELVSYVNESGMVCVVVPGKPCDVLLVLTQQGIDTFGGHFDARLRELRRR